MAEWPMYENPVRIGEAARAALKRIEELEQQVRDTDQQIRAGDKQ